MTEQNKVPGFAADGVTEILGAPGMPLMVSAVAFNALYAKLQSRGQSASECENGSKVCSECEGKGEVETGIGMMVCTSCEVDQGKSVSDMSCASCKFWIKSEKGQPGWRMGLGRCSSVPKFYDATEDVGEYDPEDCGDGARTLKREFLDVKALALDGDGYRAGMITAPDFGCVSFASLS